MFSKKLRETIVDDCYLKSYSYNCDLKDIIYMVKETGIGIKYVDIDDDHDVGFGTIGNHFSIEKFLDIYETFKYDIKRISFILESEENIYVTDKYKTITFATDDINREIEDLFNKIEPKEDIKENK